MSESANRENSTPAPESARDGARPVIALRKTCDAEGTGLSHYVLMDKAVK